jgi:hypothetical protein
MALMMATRLTTVATGLATAVTATGLMAALMMATRCCHHSIIKNHVRVLMVFCSVTTPQHEAC